MSTKSKRKTLTICNSMTAAMQKHRLSVQGLADRIGVSRSYASLVLNGKREPSLKFVGAVERLLRIPSIDDLESLPTARVQSPVRAYQVPRNQYAAMSELDLKESVLRYAQELKKENGVRMTVPMTVMRDLLDALQAKLSGL